MSQRDQVLRRIEKLKAAMPTARPIRDSVVSQSGKERAEIAFLYLSIGDEQSAATMYVEGARWSQTCGDIIGAQDARRAWRGRTRQTGPQAAPA